MGHTEVPCSSLAEPGKWYQCDGTEAEAGAASRWAPYLIVMDVKRSAFSKLSLTSIVAEELLCAWYPRHFALGVDPGERRLQRHSVALNALPGSSRLRWIASFVCASMPWLFKAFRQNPLCWTISL